MDFTRFFFFMDYEFLGNRGGLPAPLFGVPAKLSFFGGPWWKLF